MYTSSPARTSRLNPRLDKSPLCYVYFLSIIVGLTAHMPCLAENGSVQMSSVTEKLTETQTADECLSCHNADNMLVIFETAHGQQVDPNSPMANQQCESCHGTSDTHSDRQLGSGAHKPKISFDRDSSASNMNQPCLTCHEKGSMPLWQDSAHDRDEVSCINCHNIHTLNDPVSLQNSQARVCFTCHRDIESDSRKPSTHPLNVRHRGQFAAMTCSDCHNPHGSAHDNDLNKISTSEVCTGCHADYRGPFLFEHAPVSEDCGLCHNPHGSVHQSMLMRPANQMCQSCHSQRGHPSLSYTADGLPSGNPSAMILQGGCMNCHNQVHGSNHPSGYKLMR